MADEHPNQNLWEAGVRAILQVFGKMSPAERVKALNRITSKFCNICGAPDVQKYQCPNCDRMPGGNSGREKETA